MFHNSRRGKRLIRLCGKRAASLGLRHGVYFVKAIGPHKRPLHNQRPVEVLAALRRKINPILAKHRINPREHSRRRLRARCGADTPAHYLARRTADNKDITA